MLKTTLLNLTQMARWAEWTTTLTLNEPNWRYMQIQPHILSNGKNHLRRHNLKCQTECSGVAAVEQPVASRVKRMQAIPV